jgi:hypothetical protein
MGKDEAERFRRLIANSSPFDELALKLGHIEGILAKGEGQATAAPNSPNRQGMEPEPIAPNSKEVFVVHGHDGEAKRVRCAVP